jgi:hypothetical protein
MPVTVEQLADEMFEMVKEAMGKKSFKAMDLSKDDCKHAIRALIDGGRCVYSYFGGSFITLPHKEGAAPD